MATVMVKNFLKVALLAPDNENVVAFEVINLHENILNVLVKVTDIY